MKSYLIEPVNTYSAAMILYIYAVRSHIYRVSQCCDPLRFYVYVRLTILLEKWHVIYSKIYFFFVFFFFKSKLFLLLNSHLNIAITRLTNRIFINKTYPLATTVITISGSISYDFHCSDVPSGNSTLYCFTFSKTKKNKKR